MTRTKRLAVFGTTIDVAVDEALTPVLLESLADLSSDAPGVGAVRHSLEIRQADDAGEWVVTWDGLDRYRGPEPELALYDGLSAIDQHAARTAVESGATVLHGGSFVVDDRAVAVVGHSGAGKSTFTAAMTRAGRPYLADEVVAIDDDLSVRPFHRPIGLRAKGAAQLGVTVPDGSFSYAYPYRVGGQGSLAAAAPLALIALLSRSDRVAVPHLEPLSAPSALVELANQTLGALDLERTMFRRLEALVHRIPVRRLHYVEFDDAERLIVDALSRPSLGRTVR